MNPTRKQFLRLRISIWKIQLNIALLTVLRFLRKYPPFSFFFFTLEYFRREEKFNQSLKPWKQKTPHLTSEDVYDIREYAYDSYLAELEAKAEKAKKEADEAEEYRDKIKLKLEEFIQFLVQNFEPDEGMAHATKVMEMVADEPSITYERLCAYIDSIIEMRN
jgi:hypothetical protein